MKTLIARSILATVAVALLPLAVILAGPGAIYRTWQWLILHGVYRGDLNKYDRDQWRAK